MGDKHFKKLSGTHGEYELLERIQVGGMAEVFRARLCGAEGFELTVAIKRILPEIAEDSQFVAMLLDEARIAAQLSHPNIVQTIDLGLSDGEYFIAMEYVEGVDLRTLFKRCVQLRALFPRRHACWIVAEVCAALTYAHNKRGPDGPMNIVHRDVSPPNVLLSDSGEVKLIDFGVALAAQQRRARTPDGTLTGKIGYLSPEQVRGRSADHRSDIFAAGVLLWELLTTERLFRGPTEHGILEQIQRCNPALPSTRNPSVPAELDEIVATALARDPDDRYQDAVELQERLCDYMHCFGEQGGARDLATWTARVLSEDSTDDDPPTLVSKPKAPSLQKLRGNRTNAGRWAEGTTPPPVPLAEQTAEPPKQLPPVTVTFVEDSPTVVVSFESDPPGARVVAISGGIPKEIGMTPVEGVLDCEASYEVTMRKTGYRTWSGTFVFDKPESLTVSAKLQNRRSGWRADPLEETPT